MRQAMIGRRGMLNLVRQALMAALFYYTPIMITSFEEKP
jgi:hypothetical protein